MAQKRKRANRDAAVDTPQPSQKRSKQNPASTSSNKKTADGKGPPPTAYLLDKAPFAEVLTPEERRREAALYDLLGSEDVEERILAADAIISGLLGSKTSSAEANDGDNDSDSDSAAANGAETSNSHPSGCVSEPVLMRHLEKRLMRGLASGRNAARLGFSLVLAELLGQLFGPKRDLAKKHYPGLSFDRVLSALVSNTRPVGDIAGQEVRDHYLGQLFGFEAMVRADGVLFGSDGADEKGRWIAVLDALLKLYETKAWMKPQCGHVIVEGLHAMGAKGQKKLARKTLERMDEASMTMTPEGVAAWIVALGHFPDLKPKGPSKKAWKDGGHPLAAASLATLPAVLKDCGRETRPPDEGDRGKGAVNGAKKPKQQGSWAAQLHFVWGLILDHYLALREEDPDKAGQVFRQFWTQVVDETLFSKGASHSQKFSGFMIFQLMLLGGSNGPRSFIMDNLFSKNFMVCLMNQAAQEDRYLHRAALKSLKAIEGAVETQPSLLPMVLKHLLSKHGTYNFDQRTNTKTVEKILQHTTGDTATAVLKFLQHKPATPKLEASNYYQALGTYLLRLATVPAEQSEEGSERQSVTGPAIQALTDLAYVNQSLPDHIRDALRTKTTAAFARLVKRPEDFSHLCAAIVSIGESIPDDDSDADVTAASILEQAYERLNNLLDPAKAQDENRRLSAERQAIRQAMALLHAVAILQFHNSDPDAMVLLDELEECYNRLLAGADDSRSEEGGVAEFLVEILLAMVAQPSSLMRQVSQQVFESFTHLMTPQALSLLTEPLVADESAQGRAALFSTEEEDLQNAEDSSGDEGSDELDSDVEMKDASKIDGDPDHPDDEPSDELDSNSEEEEEASGNGDEAALAALDTTLSDVLRSRKLLGGAGEDDDGSDSSEDELSDMTDSEMVAMDEKLTEIFRMRMKHVAGGKAKKKEKKDAKDTVVNFKHRVLDLLAIYVRDAAAASAVPGAREGKAATPSQEENGAPLVFGVLLPLLQLMRKTAAKPLAARAYGIITEFSKGLKKARAVGGSGSGSSDGKAVSAVDANALLALLEKIHAEASRDASHAFTKAASAASLAVVAAVLQGGGKEAGSAGRSHTDDRSIKENKDEKKEKKKKQEQEQEQKAIATSATANNDAIDDTITVEDVEERVFGLYARTQRQWYRGEVRIQPAFFTDWMNWCQSHATANAAAAIAVSETGAGGDGV